jgi:ubiquinone/menaquinone biosynthesis C-methylase UbiE
MDHDNPTIASTYAAARALRPEARARWLDLVAAHAPPDSQLIADVGCGTGRFTGPLAERFGARVVGIDPSERMLAEARRKVQGDDRLEFIQASAERLPLEDGSVDLIFMSMMLHHLEDPVQAARECRRVLRTSGRIFVRNTTRESAYPHTRFFPGFKAIVASQLPSRDEVAALFEDTGLRLLASEVVATQSTGSWGDFADKIALRADSFIVRLPMSEFESGMTALRAHAARDDGSDPVVQEVNVFVFGD